MKSQPTCSVCKRNLNQPDDVSSQDCGGDCLLCMAESGDSDCAYILARDYRRLMNKYEAMCDELTARLETLCK